MMRNKTLNKFFIGSFLFLYMLVALISFIHAADFFSVGNTQWMSITLAFAFELGLAVCLASILLTKENNNIAWVLLTILVIVQVIGNTFSVFKYISLSESDYYQYLSKPLLFWVEEVSEETIQIIISWIMGAILPIVALFMTGMVSRNINSLSDEPVSNMNKESLIEDKVTQPIDAVTDTPINDTHPVEKPNFVDRLLKRNTNADTYKVEYLGDK